MGSRAGELHTNRVYTPVPDFKVTEGGHLVQFDDPVDNMRARDQRVREQWIAIEYVTVLRNRVAECYREEGVNHLENCKQVTEEYYKNLKARQLGALYAKEHK